MFEPSAKHVTKKRNKYGPWSWMILHIHRSQPAHWHLRLSATVHGHPRAPGDPPDLRGTAAPVAAAPAPSKWSNHRGPRDPNLHRWTWRWKAGSFFDRNLWVWKVSIVLYCFIILVSFFRKNINQLCFCFMNLTHLTKGVFWCAKIKHKTKEMIYRVISLLLCDSWWCQFAQIYHTLPQSKATLRYPRKLMGQESSIIQPSFQKVTKPCETWN